MSVATTDARVFHALGDPTRLTVVARLSAGPATVTALAEDHRMTMPGLLKHLRVLEQAGLVQRRKSGRVVTCSLRPAPLQQAADWLHDRTAYWSATLDRLGDLFEVPPGGRGNS